MSKGSDLSAVIRSAESHAREQYYVTALSLLYAIKHPEQALSPELNLRYVFLKETINKDRLNKQSNMREAFERVSADPQKSLDDIVTALNALLHEELTFDTEEVELRTLRSEYVNPDVWTSGKRDRYLAYYRRMVSELPQRPLNVQYDLLRQEAPKLEKVVNSIDDRLDQQLYYYVSDLWDDLNEWRNRLQRDLGRMLSVAVDRDYVGLIRKYSNPPYQEVDTLEYPPGSRTYITVKAFLMRIKQEYASYVLTQSARLFQGVVENANTLLEPGAVTSTFVSHMRLLPNKTLGQIDKDLKLALINMKPSAYLRRFSDVTVQGNRSIDPEPSHLDALYERDQFRKLRDDYLPAAYLQFEKVIEALRSDRLETVYEALEISLHAEVINHVTMLEAQRKQRIVVQRTEHDSEYVTGRFWFMCASDDDFREYVREQLEMLDAESILCLNLSVEHPHYKEMLILRNLVHEQLSYFQDTLPKIRADVDKKKALIYRQLGRIAQELDSSPANFDEIRVNLTVQRERIDDLRARYHCPVGALTSRVSQLEARLPSI